MANLNSLPAQASWIRNEAARKDDVAKGTMRQREWKTRQIRRS